MRTAYNRLRVRMTCLYCGEFTEMDIEIYFGESNSRHLYTIGDRCHWLPNREIQDGGRPENGMLDGDGFARCSTCGHDFLVKVLVRDDIITDVFQNNEKNIPTEFHGYFPERTQPAQAVACTEVVELKDKGNISFKFDAGWLTANRQAVLVKLAKLGIDIYSLTPDTTDLDSMRIMIPHNLKSIEYIDVAYLLAQLLDENFQSPPVEFVDGYPRGMKYQVRSSNDA